MQGLAGQTETSVTHRWETEASCVDGPRKGGRGVHHPRVMCTLVVKPSFAHVLRHPTSLRLQSARLASLQALFFFLLLILKSLLSPCVQHAELSTNVRRMF